MEPHLSVTKRAYSFGYKTVGFLRNRNFKDLRKSSKVLSVCFVSSNSLYYRRLEEDLPGLIPHKYSPNLVELNLQNFEIRTICCSSRSQIIFAFYLGSCMTHEMDFVMSGCFSFMKTDNEIIMQSFIFRKSIDISQELVEGTVKLDIFKGHVSHIFYVGFICHLSTDKLDRYISK